MGKLAFNYSKKWINQPGAGYNRVKFLPISIVS